MRAFIQPPTRHSKWSVLCQLPIHYDLTSAFKQCSFIRPAMIAAVSTLLLLTAAPSQADVAAIYNESCAACHDSGALNAPKKGDVQRWRELKSQKGVSSLVNSVKGGLKQMPAGGLCGQCSDEDYLALIEYMSQ